MVLFPCSWLQLPIGNGEACYVPVTMFILSIQIEDTLHITLLNLTSEAILANGVLEGEK